MRVHLQIKQGSHWDITHKQRGKIKKKQLHFNAQQQLILLKIYELIHTLHTLRDKKVKL